MLIHLFGNTWGVVASVALVLGLCICLWKLGVVSVDSPEFGKAVAVLLATTACIIPDGTWMIYNQILLIPGVILIFRAHPVNLFDRFLRGLAFSGIYWTLLIVPVCAALVTLVDYHQFFVWLPYQTLFLPPLVAIALFSMRAPGEATSDAPSDAFAVAT